MDMDVISGVNRTAESASPDVTRVDAGKAGCRTEDNGNTK